jgi:hypothetical protein
MIARQSHNTVVRLRILLAGIDPLVWRQVDVPVSLTLHDLHGVIQASMGWLDCHLHEFRVDGQPYGDPEVDEDRLFGTPAQVRRELRTHGLDKQAIDEMLERGELLLDESTVELGDLTSGRFVSFEYEYDFGDGWRHVIIVEDVGPAERGVRYPRCVAGSRACPPEDVGGLPGYAQMLEALADESHEDHQHYLDWLGGKWDAERFDLAGANDALGLLYL